MYSRGKTKSTSPSEAREIRTVRSPSFFTCKKVSRTECGTIVYGVVTGPLISIIFSWIHLPSSPDLTSGMCLYQLSSTPVRIIRPTTLKRKSLRCRRSKRVYFGHTATSFGKQYIEIPGVCVLFFWLTSFGAPATQYVRYLFQISPFSTIFADVSSQFCTSQLCNIIVWPRLMRTLLVAKSYFQCTKNWSRRTRQALRSIISNFKYNYQPENAKKKSRVIST